MGSRLLEWSVLKGSTSGGTRGMLSKTLCVCSNDATLVECRGVEMVKFLTSCFLYC